MSTIERLEQAQRDVTAGIDEAITTLKGSVEFRDAVEDLLKDTPYAKPGGGASDFEGLYGRLRNALMGRLSAPVGSPPQEPEKKYGCAPGCTYSHHGFHVAECATGKPKRL